MALIIRSEIPIVDVWAIMGGILTTLEPKVSSGRRDDASKVIRSWIRRWFAPW
jgi:hypothetical protein